MPLDLALSPAGALFLAESPDAAPALEGKWLERCTQAFAASSATGLLLLGTEALTIPLPPALAYGRDFARRYVQRLCLSSTGEPGATPVLPAEPGVLAEFTLQAPPMVGGEFLTPAVLETLWQEVGELLARESAAAGLTAWLSERNSLWHTVGRVTFHLAENKPTPETPFAFLATYTHRLSAEGKPQHIPLARALQEYAGAKNQAGLTSLLAPVQRAAEKSEWAKELIESRRLFQPLPWTPQEAHRFLKDIPKLEESGVLVRVPNWWKSGRPVRAQVNVNLGKKAGELLGLGSILDFSVEVALEGESLTAAELQQVMKAKEGLVFLKGQWVEVDRERLQQVLAQWQKVKRNGEVTFLEGMRLLAGFGRDGDDADPLAEPAAREWTRIQAGPWLRETLAAMRNPAVVAGFAPEQDLRAELRPYQRQGVHWLWFMTQLRLGACLADDMGLGKTIQTIALLLQQKRAAAGPPSLLVAPASLLANWKGELARFAPSLRCFVAHPSEASAEELAGPEALAEHDLVITTYGLVLRLAWLRAAEWRLVILDEAQTIKNPGSRQTRAVKELRSPARVALTGTPVENRLGDLWSLFDFLCPGLLGAAAEFRRTVKRLSEDPAGQNFAPLRRLIQPYLLRRLKTDRSIIADLPEKTEVAAWCVLSKVQAALYQRSVCELRDALQEADGVQRRGLVLAFLMRFKQICNHPSQWLGEAEFPPADSGKFTRLRELCEEIAARQEKALIFTQFAEMTAPLAAFLAEVFGRPGLILHGGTAVKERQKLVGQFQAPGGPPFFVLSLKAGGTGLNLTAASHVLHFDRWWNPAVEAQATDRAFRIGQKRNVLVHKFICRGTVEERIEKLLTEKKSLADGVLEGGAETRLTELPDDELLRFVSLDLPRAAGE